jgi:ABC-type phosphate transport system auxiliary subunit
LIGGQVWAVTGLPWVGGGAGTIALVVLIAFGRRLAARYRGVRFLGESRTGVDEEELVRVNNGEREPRTRIQRQGQRAPERVAGSIRALLVQSGERGPERKKGER